MKYYHIDVFSSKKLSGNGLVVIFPDKILSSKIMLSIAQEMKQFETIFIKNNDAIKFSAKIFTVDEELDFAGHPVLGATAAIHDLFFNNQKKKDLILKLNSGEKSTFSIKNKDYFNVTMNQGKPKFISTILKKNYSDIAKSINITIDDFDKNLPLEVVSTGLPYLLIPVKTNIENCKIVRNNFEKFISQFHAKFIYIFNPDNLECRTWDNFGKVEDVATGSAAGPLCAYLIKHGLTKENFKIKISQGKFVNRSSLIKAWQKKENNIDNIFISGDSVILSKGELYL